MKRQGMNAYLMDLAMSTTMRDSLSSWLLDSLVYDGSFLSSYFIPASGHVIEDKVSVHREYPLGISHVFL